MGTTVNGCWGLPVPGLYDTVGDVTLGHNGQLRFHGNLVALVQCLFFETKETLWDKSQLMLRGDDGPFP